MGSSGPSGPSGPMTPALALASVAAFAWPGEGAAAVTLRYAAVLMFSAVGGLIPGTLF